MSISWLRYPCALAGLSGALATPAAFACGSLGDAALRMHTSNGNGFYGITVANLGDVNHDGVRDYCVSEPGINAGQAYVYSGATGLLLYRVNAGPDAWLDYFGLSVTSIGDVNNDQHDDFAISAPISDVFQQMKGKVWAFSGATGDAMWMLEGDQFAEAFGWSLASIGDVNGDGAPDVAIGAPAWDDGSATSTGRVLVVSGSTGDLLWKWHDVQAGTQLGYALAGVADRDGDGRDELAIGSIVASTVFIVGSASHHEIDRIIGQGGSGFGSSLARIDDVNGDGRDDLIIGAPRRSAGSVMRGSATICNGASGSVLLECFGEPNSEFGWSVAATDDINGDGVADMLVGAHNHRIHGDGVGRIEVRSSVDGLPLRRIDGDPARLRFGAAVAGLDDLDGDGVGELLVGQEGTFGEPGAAYVFSGAPHDAGEMRVTHFQPASAMPARTILADLDGDGAAEMIVIDEANDRIAVRANNGSGGYYAPAYLNVGRGPADAICVDLDSDGDRDLVVALRKENALAVYSNSHGVLFRSGVIKVNRQPVSVVAGDFNGDHRVDLAVAGRRDRNLLILRQTPVSWTYLHKRFATKRLIPLTDEPTRLFNARLNDNTRPDLLVISATAGRCTAFVDVNANPMLPAIPTTLGLPGSGTAIIADFAVGDTDGDRLSDIIWCDGATAEVQVQRGLGDGAFGGAVSHAGSGPVVRSVCAVDLDQNGVDDLALTEPDASKVTLLIMPRDAGVPAMFTYPSIADARWLMRGDAEGDDDIDVSVINDQGAMTLLRNLILDP